MRSLVALGLVVLAGTAVGCGGDRDDPKPVRPSGDFTATITVPPGQPLRMTCAKAGNRSSTTLTAARRDAICTRLRAIVRRPTACPPARRGQMVARIVVEQGGARTRVQATLDGCDDAFIRIQELWRQGSHVASGKVVITQREVLPPRPAVPGTPFSGSSTPSRERADKGRRPARTPSKPAPRLDRAQVVECPRSAAARRRLTTICVVTTRRTYGPDGALVKTERGR